jgi:hypothetical protein
MDEARDWYLPPLPFSIKLGVMESRRGVRYPVELDCTVSSMAPANVSISGKTINMSNRGMLLEFPRAGAPLAALGVGDLARVIVELPGVPYFRQCSLDCMCRVVRYEDTSDCFRLALSVWRHYFRDPSKNPGSAP